MHQPSLDGKENVSPSTVAIPLRLSRLTNEVHGIIEEILGIL